MLNARSSLDIHEELFVVKQLGLGLGMGMENRNAKWNRKVPPVPGDESIILGATTTTVRECTSISRGVKKGSKSDKVILVRSLNNAGNF